MKITPKHHEFYLKYKDKNNTYTFQDLIKKGVQK